MSVGINGEMRIRIDGQRLSVKSDAGLCELHDFFIKAVRDNRRIPYWIKHAICIMLRERGGERFGAKKKLIFLLLEIAMQLKDGHPVPGECLQWDDNIFIGMIVKLKEALRAIKHLLPSNVETAALLGWPCAKMREDRVINKIAATEYTGVERMSTPYDGPVNPDAKTIAEAYSSKYTVKRFNNAIEGIEEFVLAAWLLRFIGCLFLLDRNDLACRETGVSLDSILEKYGFKMVGTLYEHPHDIILYKSEKAAIVVHHGPLCVGGSIMVERFTINDLLLRCLVIDTLRGMVCMANGEEFTGPYLAIEAGMMQKLLVDGLHLDRKYGHASVFFREYLTPPEKNCFDLYGGNQHGPIQHYLDYPITDTNRDRYRKWSK